MTRQEGVTKFRLDYQETPPYERASVSDLLHWRGVLYEKGLIGQAPNRYGGAGFGNISLRQPPYDAPPKQRPFYITGTQTGHLSSLEENHICLVTFCDPDQNTVRAAGPVPPSSEALTHGILFDEEERWRVVMHVHCPSIWNKAASIRLPITNTEAEYGTPAMAEELRRIVKKPEALPYNLIVMGGHTDGVVSFGETFADAGEALFNALRLSASA